MEKIREKEEGEARATAGDADDDEDGMPRLPPKVSSCRSSTDTTQSMFAHVTVVAFAVRCARGNHRVHWKSVLQGRVRVLHLILRMQYPCAQKPVVAHCMCAALHAAYISVLNVLSSSAAVGSTALPRVLSHL